MDNDQLTSLIRFFVIFPALSALCPLVLNCYISVDESILDDVEDPQFSRDYDGTVVKTL